LQFPVRWYCNVNCHRYERPQRGRTREHWQINVDIFGSDSPNCEVEVFEVVHAMLASVGASRDDYRVRANDRIMLDSLLTDVIGVQADQIQPVFSILDRWAKYPRAELLAAAVEIGLSDRQFGRLEDALAAGDGVLSLLPADIVQRSALASLLTGPDRDLVTFDPVIVRGLAYYTSTVFEVFDTDPANPRALFGGGRYDDLTSLFSAQRIPGIGFAMGDVTLMDFLRTHDLLPSPRASCQVVVLPLDAGLQASARAVAGQMRAAGYSATVPIEPRKLGTELKRAAASGTAVAIIIGSQERERAELTVRDLASNAQFTVPEDEAGAAVARILSA
jgi:histidyl-tRNA synthetase